MRGDETVTRFALTSYGTRGDIEPCVAVARELLRRGHDVSMVVPPDLVGFVDSAGLSCSPYGFDVHDQVYGFRDFWTYFFRNFWRIASVVAMWREMWDGVIDRWQDISTTLIAAAEGADLLVTGPGYQDVAANVAEYFDMPLATLNYFPMRPNGQLVPALPPGATRVAMRLHDWLAWRLTKRVEDTQRRALNLAPTTAPLPRRVADAGALEIQAYDEVCFPGLADEWARWGTLRPFVGTLTMALPTDADADIAAWVHDGRPPIYFGFGSIPLESPRDTVEMISAACADLGERGLICAGWSDFRGVPHYDNVKLVTAVNHAAVFPQCRAVVHHGGSGTTGACLRAGVPSLILWTAVDQPVFAMQTKQLGVGLGRRFSATTRESLVADLRQILAPEYATRAHRLAARVTTAEVSVQRTADLLEEFARSERVRWSAGPAGRRARKGRRPR